MLNFKFFYNELPMEAKKIREEVFVFEQGFKEEFDSIDGKATHLLIYEDDKAIATGRSFLSSDQNYYLGRIAIKKEYRNKGIGSKVLDLLEEELKNKSIKKVYLHSQLQAKEFYLKNGYQVSGDIFLEENSPHILMFKSLN